MFSLPLERGGVPGIRRCFLTVECTHNEVVEKDQLGKANYQRRNRDAGVNTLS